MKSILLSILISMNLINPSPKENINISNIDIDSSYISNFIDNKIKIKEVEEERNRIMSVGFDTNNVLSISNIKHEEMYDILYNTGMQDVAWTIVQCEKDYGINAFILAALIAEESGWGTSSRAINQNNLSGFEVFDDLAVGAIFNSRDDSVIATAKLLKDDYLTKGGQYHNGYSLESINILYSANPLWADNISSIADTLKNKYLKLIEG